MSIFGVIIDKRFDRSIQIGHSIVLGSMQFSGDNLTLSSVPTLPHLIRQWVPSIVCGETCVMINCLRTHDTGHVKLAAYFGSH
jgi:hypothetical protein